MTASSIDISEVTAISILAATSDIWFVDIWGVLHNGVKPYASAVDACRKFREGGGTVVLVSNSPRPRDGVIRQLEQVGVAADVYNAVVTSGDVTRNLIARWNGHAIRHIGPDRDAPLFDGFDVRRVDVHAADVVVCTGLFDDETETPEDYREEISTLRQRGLTMICANPDITVERGGRIVYCAGALANAYEALGGAVLTAGKPHRPIYDAAMTLARDARGRSVDASRVLAIGDGVRTDIAGAGAFGIRAIFVASAVDVHAGEQLADAARRLFAGSNAAPIAVMRALSW